MDGFIKLIADKKIKMYRLAKDLQVPRSTVRSWLTGSVPREEHLNALAKYLHVEPAYLVFGDPQYAPHINNEIQYLLNEAEQLGVKEDGITYLKFRIKEAKKLKHTGVNKGKAARHKAGSG